MVTKASVDSLNTDNKKKAAFLSDLQGVIQKHGLSVDPKFADLVAKPDSAKISPAMSSFVVTITA